MTRVTIARGRGWLLAAGVLFATACSEAANAPGQFVRAPVTVTATLTPAQQATVAGMSVEVTGSGISTPIIVTLAVNGATVNGTVQVPVGAGRTFTVRAYDATGAETYNGSATTTVVAGTNPPLTVRLTALEGSVPIDVTIGTFGITLTPPAPSVAVDQAVTLTASVMRDGAPVAGALTWGLVNPALVTLTVAPDGRSAEVRGRIVGSTRVVASYEGVAAASVVTVTALPANQAPIAKANGPYSGKAQVPIMFYSTGSSDPDGTIVAFAWTFGDGTTSTQANPVKSYAQSGTYPVTLTITDDDGATATSSATATVGPANQLPSATIGGPYASTAGTPVTLTAAGNDADGSVAGFEWTVQGESLPTRTSIGSYTRTFMTAGTYTVTVAAVDNDGAVGPGASTTVTVTAPPSNGTFAATSVVAGNGHTCALTAAGTVYCWGLGTSGQLGNGTSTSSATPVQVIMPSGVSAFTQLVSGGGSYTCAYDGGRSAYCWGLNGDGQLGVGDTQNRDRPTKIMVGLTIETLGVGHACGNYLGTRSCWGSNASGQITGSTGGSFATPRAMSDPTGVSTFAALAGGTFTCFAQSTVINGTTQRFVTCRGTGPGDWTVNQGTSATPRFAGFDYACATFTGNATIQCWGNNSAGQFGVGSGGTGLGPTTVNGNGYSPSAFGWAHTCGTYNGATACSGNNLNGQLGDGNANTNRASPVLVSGASLTGLAAGANHTCGIRSGNVFCWGGNGDGQLGDGTTTQRTVPTAVAGYSTPNQPPTVNMQATFTGRVGQPVTISASGSDPDGTIVEYRWSFSDLIVQPGPTAFGTVTRTFSSANTYQVVVVAVDNRGALSPSRSAIITITP